MKRMTGYFQYTKITDGVLAAACVLPRLVDRLFEATSASQWQWKPVAAHVKRFFVVHSCRSLRSPLSGSFCKSPAFRAGGPQRSREVPFYADDWTIRPFTSMSLYEGMSGMSSSVSNSKSSSLSW